MHSIDQVRPSLATLSCLLEHACTSRGGGRGPGKVQEKVKVGAVLKMALTLNAFTCSYRLINRKEKSCWLKVFEHMCDESCLTKSYVDTDLTFGKSCMGEEGNQNKTKKAHQPLFILYRDRLHRSIPGKLLNNNNFWIEGNLN